jgi:small subunit ribosomal protein S1
MVQGTVSKLMDFGAFVRLEPGVEGLVHISEISHQRVHRTADVLREGQTVEVQVLSVDVPAQRISLSMKALEARPTTISKEKQLEEAALDALEAEAPAKKKHTGPLKGGVGRPSGGESIGLNW